MSVLNLPSLSLFLSTWYRFVNSCVSLCSRYGMAHVYYAQEKYTFAETYAGRALSINKCSSIACTQLALVSRYTTTYNISNVFSSK